MTRRGNARGVRRAALAAMMVSALGLAACGSDSDGDEETTSASATTGHTTTSTTQSEESETPSASESAPETEPETPEDQDPEQYPEAQREDEPEQRGAPAASEGDAAQIRAVSEGLAGDRPYADYMQYVYDNTCTADIDRLGGRDSYREQIGEARKENEMWSEVAGGQGNIPDVHGVNDIQVQGDRATANVDRTLGGNRNTELVTYVREDGAWKTCASA
ncbi:MAG: hypothetical protein L0H20_03490 [Corynebacterium sp.]|uniref:hypothetical protein n=2 Tax=Corynebacterium sp. TaxID=1720 RepID=UPI00264A0A01|nr:hypothetical protein [Corynebacterium sp.]MDN5722056.1 hypothetical protein [Corynebacterium sp.]